MLLLLPVKIEPSLAQRQEMEKGRQLCLNLLSFMLPFPFIDIKILMSRDGDVFSWCPEAAVLSAHKYLQEWMSQSMKMDFLS